MSRKSTGRCGVTDEWGDPVQGGVNCRQTGVGVSRAAKKQHSDYQRSKSAVAAKRATSNPKKAEKKHTSALFDDSQMDFDRNFGGAVDNKRDEAYLREILIEEKGKKEDKSLRKMLAETNALLARDAAKKKILTDRQKIEIG